jgi:hypothetical protein
MKLKAEARAQGDCRASEKENTHKATETYVNV